MPYLIDGHNLIPKIPGLSLAEFDDEARLIEMLQEFCRLARKEAEVFFDNAPAGGMPVRSYGLLTARFIRSGRTADDAIRKRLDKLGRAARNWTVVSSDHAVQASARAAQARVLGSEAFAAQVLRTLEGAGKDTGASADAGLSEDEVDEWLDLFGGSET
jgi:predicted RNA-binding protein with PIN domain